MTLNQYLKQVLTEARRNPKAQKYYEIVFMQGEEADEPLKILDNKGESAAIEYLADWDYGGEMEHTEVEAPWGPHDDTFEEDDYVLSYNDRLGYIGLVRKVKEEDNEEPKKETREITPKETEEKEAKKESSFIDGAGRMINEIELSTPDQHQKKIALDTLKLSRIGAKLMGGMNHKDAVIFLRKIKYPDTKIISILKKAGHSDSDINEFTE